MDQAQSAYAAAQGQFPSVLGSLSPQIQEANLGEKGIYFRVRVGPWASRDEAIGVCESLKAAGGSCFVTQ
jgi:cell division septation protein DedD